MTTYDFETFSASFPADGVLLLEINRPKQMNAMNQKFWEECRRIIHKASKDSRVRVIVLTGGTSKHFSAGLDLHDFSHLFEVESGSDPSRRALRLRQMVLDMQSAFTAFSECPVPVIVAVHGACVGGGVDMVSACDVRWSTHDTRFSIKEVDIGLAADIGTLQRVPKIVGSDSFVRELAFTGRSFDGKEALDRGFVSRIFANKHTLFEEAIKLASEISSKSPTAVQGAKHIMNYSRDHSVADGLGYTATWNGVMLQSFDLLEAASSKLDGRKPIFAKI